MQFREAPFFTWEIPERSRRENRRSACALTESQGRFSSEQSPYLASTLDPLTFGPGLRDLDVLGHRAARVFRLPRRGVFVFDQSDHGRRQLVGSLGRLTYPPASAAYRSVRTSPSTESSTDLPPGYGVVQF